VGGVKKSFTVRKPIADQRTVGGYGGDKKERKENEVWGWSRGPRAIEDLAKGT